MKLKILILARPEQRLAESSGESCFAVQKGVFQSGLAENARLDRPLDRGGRRAEELVNKFPSTAREHSEVEALGRVSSRARRGIGR